MTRYGLLYARVHGDQRGRRAILGDEKNRRILFRFEMDPTKSFLILQDVVSGRYLGWDSLDEQMILVDEGITTRNLLQIKGHLGHFQILGSAEQGGTTRFEWSIGEILLGQV